MLQEKHPTLRIIDYCYDRFWYTEEIYKLMETKQDIETLWLELTDQRNKFQSNIEKYESAIKVFENKHESRTTEYEQKVKFITSLSEFITTAALDYLKIQKIHEDYRIATKQYYQDDANLRALLQIEETSLKDITSKLDAITCQVVLIDSNTQDEDGLCGNLRLDGDSCFF